MSRTSRLIPIAAAALLAASGAMAQQQGESLGQKAGRVFDRAENSVQRATEPRPGEPRNPTIGQRADRVFDKMEAGTQRAMNRATGKDPDAGKNAAADPDVRHDPTRRDPTTRMGAGPARHHDSRSAAYDNSEAARRARMDDAYRSWQSRP